MIKFGKFLFQRVTLSAFILRITASISSTAAVAASVAESTVTK